MDAVTGTVSQAGQNVVDSGVLGSMVIILLAMLSIIVWQFIKTINKNTAALVRFTDILQRLPCLDRDGESVCLYDKRKEKE